MSDGRLQTTCGAHTEQIWQSYVGCESLFEDFWIVAFVFPHHKTTKGEILEFVSLGVRTPIQAPELVRVRPRSAPEPPTT